MSRRLTRFLWSAGIHHRFFGFSSGEYSAPKAVMNPRTPKKADQETELSCDIPAAKSYPCREIRHVNDLYVLRSDRWNDFGLPVRTNPCRLWWARLALRSRRSGP